MRSIVSVLRVARHAVPAMLLCLAAGCGADGERQSASGAGEAAGNGPRAAPPSDEPLDPCALLTAAEIEAATGVGPGEPSAVSRGCSWPSADGSNPLLVSLAVTEGDLSRDQWLELGGSQEEIVDGVGDFAVRVGSQLQVYQDGWMVGIAVKGGDRPEARRELALAAHARIGGG